MAERGECSYHPNEKDDFLENMQSLSLSLSVSSNEEDNNEDLGLSVNEEDDDEDIGISANEEDDVEDFCNQGLEESSQVDTVEDFGQIMFSMLRPDEVTQFNFPNVGIAYEFYNEYGKARGFSIRKHKTLRSKGESTFGDILYKSFVCSRQGTRDSKHIDNPDRQREPRNITRCDCKAEFRVHINAKSGRWHVSLFADEHSHDLMPPKFVGRLRSQRRMSNGDRAEMNNMKKVGIPIPKFFASFAQQAGGYGNVPFNKKKMYNEQSRERQKRNGEAEAALSLLRDMASVDPKVYWKHQTDAEGKLLHLFWCDGESVVDYSVFGDILSFDATYGRNKYKCPVVVFSGVNHHMQTVVFACAILSNEKEVTYTWILEQFLAAMEGKCPKAVITDGDRSMRNAIKRVFRNAHHRLCGWHLLRNATREVHKPAFTSGFAWCMFNDYEVDEFEEKWEKVVVDNGVQNHQWVKGIYAKKKMWATTYMRGFFFAGIRTTSRCEGLHTQIGKYVGSKDSLYEFLQHFQWCLNYIRNNEIEADKKSLEGDPKLQTCLPTLELSGAQIYTEAIFKLFRARLLEVASLNVQAARQTPNSIIYVVNKYTNRNVRSKWFACHFPNDVEWRCPCEGMESFGIPCVHILKVLVLLDIHELPLSLVCRRWTKNVKEGLEHIDSFGNTSNSTNRCTRFGSLLHFCKRLCSVACRSLEDYNRVRERMNNEIEDLLSKTPLAEPPSTRPSRSKAGVHVDVIVGDPVRVRTKGCGSSRSARERKLKRTRLCSTCREPCHNKRKCPDSHGTQPVGNTTSVDSADQDESEEGEECYVDDESENEYMLSIHEELLK